MKRAIIDIHLDPRIYTIDKFLSPFECRSLLARAKGSKMERAHVIGPVKSQLSDSRTNDLCWVNHHQDPAFTRIAKRIAGLVGMPLSHAESFQVVRYRPGTEYKAHLDAFDPRTKEGANNWPRGGQRLITALGYLNDVEAGGETEFPKLDISISPEMGKLLVFHNCEPGTIRRHPLSLHAGKPVIKGEKWAFNLWFRARTRLEETPPTEKELREFGQK